MRIAGLGRLRLIVAAVMVLGGSPFQMWPGLRRRRPPAAAPQAALRGYPPLSLDKPSKNSDPPSSSSGRY